MKLLEIKGDLFENIGNHDTIAHGVNCIGAMASGIAAPIRKRYPLNYSVYQLHCAGGLLKPGGILPVVDQETLVINMATQYYPGADAKYQHVAQSAEVLYEFCVGTQVPVVKLPKIGCGIGGLEWDIVASILDEAGGNDITLEVYYL
jgi:O-acetyl-ADP-ribose deacetylase (regulator of RNase III)